MLTSEDLPILTVAGIVCVVAIVLITAVTLLTDWRIRRKRLALQLQRVRERHGRPLRNVDRFASWKEAMSWYYTYDRKTEQPHDGGCSAAFLDWLFATPPHGILKEAR